jgi:CDP-diacylglycerol--glycerol-3-phosphate 3-phosphatidyltransferase
MNSRRSGSYYIAETLCNRFFAAAIELGRHRLRTLRDFLEKGAASGSSFEGRSRVFALSVRSAPRIKTRWVPPSGSPLRLLPNALTLCRILLTPVCAILLYRVSVYGVWPAGTLFAVMALTDQVDGMLARSWRAESVFGKVADPLADKLLIGTVIFFLIFAHRLPWLALALPLARHGLLWTGRLLRPRHGMLAPSWAGKLSAWMVYTAVGLMIVTANGAMWIMLLFWVGMATGFLDVFDMLAAGLRVPAQRLRLAVAARLTDRSGPGSSVTSEFASLTSRSAWTAAPGTSSILSASNLGSQPIYKDVVCK